MLVREMDAAEKDGDRRLQIGSGNTAVLISQLPASVIGSPPSADGAAAAAAAAASESYR